MKFEVLLNFEDIIKQKRSGQSWVLGIGKKIGRGISFKTRLNFQRGLHCHDKVTEIGITCL